LSVVKVNRLSETPSVIPSRQFSVAFVTDSVFMTIPYSFTTSERQLVSTPEKASDENKR